MIGFLVAWSAVTSAIAIVGVADVYLVITKRPTISQRIWKSKWFPAFALGYGLLGGHLFL